jgi:queuine/archaeosine tRNA-ribosyltransferase
MLGPILLTHHNLMFYQRLMSAAREHIAAGTFLEWLALQRTKLSGSEVGEVNDPNSVSEPSSVSE